ncbi:holo-[acyl-carrier protein] synthase [Variovorax boronicumulans]|uniref:holo-ACP synthase n=1 Tax=Variovorax boronicumulans TaxID=436515 RepID=UPI00339452EC
MKEGTNVLSIRCNDCCSSLGRVRVGVDVVATSAIEASIQNFGERFVRRIFTAHEIATANGAVSRLAARFAAKEAAIKAFDMSETGVDWRHIELRSDTARRPTLHFYGSARKRVDSFNPMDVSVSLSHEFDIAVATVVALLSP